MPSPAPEAQAEIERLNIELQDLSHKLDEAKDEKDRHLLNCHQAELEEQIKTLKRRMTQ
jgi:hypothetical protein